MKFVFRKRNFIQYVGRMRMEMLDWSTWNCRHLISFYQQSWWFHVDPPIISGEQTFCGVLILQTPPEHQVLEVRQSPCSASFLSVLFGGTLPSVLPFIGDADSKDNPRFGGRRERPAGLPHSGQPHGWATGPYSWQQSFLWQMPLRADAAPGIS